MSSIGIPSVQRPYVRFENRAVEDRERTIKEGRTCYKDVGFAIVLSPGSKDEMEKIADEWLTSMAQQSNMQGREYLADWHQFFKKQYEAWKEGNEIPESGTPIRMCLAFRPAEAQAILAANIRTLEDLALANDDALSRMGIGGRSLKERAIDMMRTAKNVSAVSEEFNALKVRMEMLEQENKELNARLLAVTSKHTKAA